MKRATINLLSIFAGLIIGACCQAQTPPTPPAVALKRVNIEEERVKRSKAAIRVETERRQREAAKLRAVNRKLLEAVKSPENKAVLLALERRKQEDLRQKQLHQHPQRASAPFENIKAKR